MKNSFLTLFFLLFTSVIFSQNLLESKIIGNWKVKKVVHANDNPNLKALINSFAEATFTFEENHLFKVTTTKNSELFKMFATMANGKQWVTKSDSIIAIGSKSDHYNIVKIIYQSDNNTVTFTLYETDLELEVEKIP